jgi:hypothetical protein
MREAKSLAASAPPEDLAAAELAAAKAEIARLTAELASAPKLPPPPPPKLVGPPRTDADLYGDVLTIPRQFHGIYLRDPIRLQGKEYNPGGKYKTGPHGKPLTVGEVRTILSMASQACHLLANKDKDHGHVVSLGRFHGDSE